MTTSNSRRPTTKASADGNPDLGARRRSRVWLFSVATALASIDLGLKQLAQEHLTAPVDLGILDLRLTYNSGVAFSLGQTLPEAVVLLGTLLLTAGVGLYAYTTAHHGGTLHRIGLAAVLAGAVANVLDRARDGVVTDYLHTGWFPTFNLADTWITVGAVALLLYQFPFTRTTPQPALRPSNREQPAGGPDG